MTIRIDREPGVDGQLRRGVNLSHWYAQVYAEPGYVDAHFERHVTDLDIQLIAALGFDHVRLPISWEWLFTPGRQADNMARIVDSVEHLQRADLTVIVDAHPEMGFKEALHSEAGVANLVEGWRQLAIRLASLPVTRTVMELLNEPSLDDPERWHDVARQSLAAVRESCPEHLVILSGDGYSELPHLLELPVIEDAHIAYNFHLYDPMIISHQSAYFTQDWAKAIAGLEYPTDAENIATLLREPLPERSLRELEEYRSSPWDRSRYRRLLAPAVAFANERGVALTCNEFGIYRKAPRSTRAAWLADVSRSLEEVGIGWSVWDYAGDFRVVAGASAHPIADLEIVHALGLIENS